MEHVAETWQGLDQGLVGWISHGYYNVCVSSYKEGKDPGVLRTGKKALIVEEYQKLDR